MLNEFQQYIVDCYSMFVYNKIYSLMDSNLYKGKVYYLRNDINSKEINLCFSGNIRGSYLATKYSLRMPSPLAYIVTREDDTYSVHYSNGHIIKIPMNISW